MKISRRILAIVFFVFMLCSVPVCAGADGARVMYSENSLYQYIVVLEDPGRRERYLATQDRGVYQGGMYLGDPGELMFEYTRMAFVGLAFLGEGRIGDALFIGQGVGSMPMYMGRRYPETAIDVVELDPAVDRIARDYFAFTDMPSLRVHHQDGRIFLKKTKKKYDIVFLDAYQGGTIPFHLTTREFFREIKKVLKPGGVVVSNVMSSMRNRFFTSMIRTHQAEFSQLFLFDGESSGNHIFVASMDPLRPGVETVAARARAIEAERRLHLGLVNIARRMSPASEYRAGGAELLTDDFAPVNLYRQMKAQ